MQRTVVSASVLLLALSCTAATPPSTRPAAMRPPFRNQLVVSPDGPDDGGDFGPHTPGTQTSGLQEAPDAAKARGMDLYIDGGSWTAGKTNPIVYNLQTTLHVPWMQDFRLDSGNCVLNYTPRSGDAVVFDSQMSCSYRFGLIVSSSDGAVVRLRPTTAGPDRFKVITSTEFVFNALVGGGGAWPGGEPYNTKLDPAHRWVGAGLVLDGSEGSIDANKITVIETVGCATGLGLSGAVTRNTIEEVNVHLCRNGLLVGGPADPVPADNRIEVFVDNQGISPSSAARIYWRRNLLTLSVRPGGKGSDLSFEAPAAGNLAILHSPCGLSDLSDGHTNRVMGWQGAADLTAAMPPAGQPCRNEAPVAAEVQIVKVGRVQHWAEKTPSGDWCEFGGPMVPGQSFILNPGDSVRLDYTEPPTWRWKAVR